MSTKDPHIALIDAHEKIHNVKMMVKQALARVREKEVLSDMDKVMIAAIKQQAIDSVRRIQDELAEELESHGLHLESDNEPAI
jgi:hypothetical protein